jgi:soluble lytic murein transglycosylase-like protein
MPSSINLRDLITQEAEAQGVPVSIALAVAQTESGTAQWTPSGNLVTSPAGAIGVFQLMALTAKQLGVDQNDLNGNIHGGITYIAQLFEKYGDWSKALAAYNWGPGNVDSNSSFPQSVWNYVQKVLGLGNAYQQALNPNLPANVSAAGITTADVLSGVTPGNTFLYLAGVLGVGLVLYEWLSD